MKKYGSPVIEHNAKSRRVRRKFKSKTYIFTEWYDWINPKVGAICCPICGRMAFHELDCKYNKNERTTT